MDLIKHQRQDIDKNYLYIKDQYESKYKWFVSRRVGTKKLKNKKAFIDCSQTVEGLEEFRNLEDYNLGKKIKVVIVFDDMMPGIEANKKLSPIVTGLFFIGIKLVITLVLKLQSCFKVSKTIRQNATQYTQQKRTTTNSIKSFVWYWVKILWSFTKIALKNHFHFSWTIQLYHQIIH